VFRLDGLVHRSRMRGLMGHDIGHPMVGFLSAKCTPSLSRMFSESAIVADCCPVQARHQLPEQLGSAGSCCGIWLDPCWALDVGPVMGVSVSGEEQEKELWRGTEGAKAGRIRAGSVQTS
jgi:hypothetical protein